MRPVGQAGDVLPVFSELGSSSVAKLVSMYSSGRWGQRSKFHNSEQLSQMSQAKTSPEGQELLTAAA